LARWLTILTARQRRVALASRPDLATLKRWLRRERTLLTAVAAGASPAALAELLLAADTDRGSPTEDTRLILQTRPSSAST